MASHPLDASGGPAAALMTSISDPRCPRGLGVAIDTSAWTDPAVESAPGWESDLTAAMLPSGNTLVIASGAPKAHSAIAVEFRTPCAVDSAFGEGGATELDRTDGIDISEVIPSPGGGVLIAGSTSPADYFARRWLVGELLPDGRPDPTFGRAGSVVLPWRGGAGPLAVTGDGDVLVGGTDRADLNGESMVTELDPGGHVVASFGRNGRAPMPAFHDGGLAGMWVEPSGDILALVGGGNMGCWGLTAVTLTPGGQRIPAFTARFLRSLRTADPGRCSYPVFVGNAVMHRHGFHLAGTAQRACVNYGCTEHPDSGPDPSEHIADIAFTFAGDLDRTFGSDGVADTPAPMADAAWALPQTNGTVVLVTSPATGDASANRARAKLLVYRLLASGRVDTSYAHHGVADIRQPYTNSDFNLSLPVSNGRESAIVVNVAPGNRVMLTLIRTT